MMSTRCCLIDSIDAMAAIGPKAAYSGGSALIGTSKAASSSASFASALVSSAAICWRSA
ncbi:hypothetical protein [Rhizobium sp. ZW T2_16]|uniref:hypothetical protein n=1 Tax=Rhizobium sp. ZW T2_16 TaxID=3378083 RepID=UPI003851A4EE